MMNEKPRMNGHIQRTSSPLVRTDTTDRYGDIPDRAGLLHLLVGAALVGADELRDWLRDADDASDAEDGAGEASEAQASPSRADAAASRDSLSYALVGMLFEAESSMRRGFSAALSRMARRAHDVNAWYSRFTLEMYQTPLDPPLERFDDLLTRLTDQIDRWSERGWREERQSRHVTERVFGEAVDELLTYMAHNPEVRKLVEQQGIGMAESAADEARARAEAADQWVERLAHGLLRRKPSAEGAADGSSATTPATTGAAQSPHATPRGASQASETGKSPSRAAKAALPTADLGE